MISTAWYISIKVLNTKNAVKCLTIYTHVVKVIKGMQIYLSSSKWSSVGRVEDPGCARYRTHSKLLTILCGR